MKLCTTVVEPLKQVIQQHQALHHPAQLQQLIHLQRSKNVVCPQIALSITFVLGAPDTKHRDLEKHHSLPSLAVAPAVTTFAAGAATSEGGLFMLLTVEDESVLQLCCMVLPSVAVICHWTCNHLSS